MIFSGEMRFGFWDHVIQFSNRQMNFPYTYFPNYEKLKSCVETFTPYNQIGTYFRGTFMDVR